MFRSLLNLPNSEFQNLLFPMTYVEVIQTSKIKIFRFILLASCWSKSIASDCWKRIHRCILYTGWWQSTSVFHYFNIIEVQDSFKHLDSAIFVQTMTQYIEGCPFLPFPPYLRVILQVKPNLFNRLERWIYRGQTSPGRIRNASVVRKLKWAVLQLPQSSLLQPLI